MKKENVILIRVVLMLIFMVVFVFTSIENQKESLAIQQQILRNQQQNLEPQTQLPVKRTPIGYSTPSKELAS